MQISSSSVSSPAVEPVHSVDAEALCLVRAPVGREKILGVTGHHPFECEYEICAPQDAGLAMDELRRLLDGEAETDAAQTYVHPYFEGDEQTPQGTLCTLFAEDMATPDFSANAAGLRATERDAQYLLVARNEQGDAAGYIQFRVSLFPEPDDAPASAPQQHMGLVVTLERIFVRPAERNVGIGTALLEKVGFVVWEELRNIGMTFRAQAGAQGRPVVVHPYVLSTWHSWAGKMAHYRLVDLVTQYRDAASDDFSSQTLRFAGVCEQGQY